LSTAGDAPGRQDEFREAEREILTRRPEHAIEPTLDRIADLTALLGDPQRSYPVIHVTGTNGKTSTARMIQALLRARGLRTGLFTSPHLTSITERIVIDGHPITTEQFVAAYDELAPYVAFVDGRHPVPLSFFEVLTGMAFAVFADVPVDVAIVEVGLGGTWDATNVADGAVAVVTPISLDHTAWLGDTVQQIAADKAGIIKPGSVAVLAQQPLPAAEELLRRAVTVGASVVREGLEFGVLSRDLAVGGQRLDLRGLRADYYDIALPLFGSYQAGNAAVALAAVEAFATGAALPGQSQPADSEGEADRSDEAEAGRPDETAGGEAERPDETAGFPSQDDGSVVADPADEHVAGVAGGTPAVSSGRPAGKELDTAHPDEGRDGGIAGVTPATSAISDTAGSGATEPSVKQGQPAVPSSPPSPPAVPLSRPSAEELGSGVVLPGWTAPSEPLGEDLVRQGLASVRSPGRMEVVRRSPVVIVDAAHNPAGMAASMEALTEAFTFAAVIGVLAVSEDKDVAGILDQMEPVISELVVTRNSSDRSMDPVKLAELAASVFGAERVAVAGRIDDALELAVSLADAASGDEGLARIGVLVTGSVITAGDARLLLATPGREAGPDGEAGPEYGEDAAEYGEDGAEYGEAGPEYGEAGPEYGEDAAGYGEEAPE
jgi:folylpolyglutamate synthase/dihydropteroate synthase